MGHNLNVENGKVAMAYTGKEPWHNLGVKVDHAMTSGEAITAASLDYRVEKMPIYFGGGTEIKDKFATVRVDTNEPLGIVGNVYKVLQNKEAFSFFDSIVGEKLAMYHTAGALGKGERIWLLAKLPKEFWVTPEDKIEQYLLLTNSHDGMRSVEIMATPIRVVCQNTLNIAMGTGRKTKVRHTLNMGSGIKEIRTQLGIADDYFGQFEEMAKELLSRPATSAVVEQLFDDLGLSKKKADESTRTDNIRYEILKCFETGKGNSLPNVRGTQWALFNGLTEYVDYYRSTKGGQEKRTDSILFGSGANMKQKAIDSLLAVR